MSVPANWENTWHTCCTSSWLNSPKGTQANVVKQQTVNIRSLALLWNDCRDQDWPEQLTLPKNPHDSLQNLVFTNGAWSPTMSLGFRRSCVTCSAAEEALSALFTAGWLHICTGFLVRTGASRFTRPRLLFEVSLWGNCVFLPLATTSVWLELNYN